MPAVVRTMYFLYCNTKKGRHTRKYNEHDAFKARGDYRPQAGKNRFQEYVSLNDFALKRGENRVVDDKVNF